MMPLVLVKISVLFLAALVALVAMRRSTAALRHLVCVCAAAGSLILPLTALLPARVLAIPLPVIKGAAVSATAASAGHSSLAAVFLGLWAAGTAVFMLRLAIGHARAARAVRDAAPAGFDQVCFGDGVYFADVSVPIVCGLVDSAILMPRASAAWPAWQFDAAVRHEQMHVRRMDLWTNFVAQIACAVWWFHPLAWILFGRLRDEQEAACDDAILFSGFEPATYAEALLAVARTSTPDLLNGCAMTTQMNLKSRITRLLDRSLARTTSRTSFLRTAVVFAIAFGAIGVVSPTKSIAQAESPYKVGGDVTAPRVLYREDPVYTEDATAAKINGTVILSIVVGTDGLAHDINVVKGLDAGLDKSAALAVEKWHFEPGKRNGEPVAVRATIEVNFRLK
jgi:TonB family protein